MAKSSSSGKKRPSVKKIKAPHIGPRPKGSSVFKGGTRKSR